MTTKHIDIRKITNMPHGHVGNLSMPMWHVGNLSRNTMGTVGAQYGQVSSSSWGTVEAQLGQKAQYGHSMARFSIGTVWVQLGHSRGTNE